jgi:hypothetical protein
VKIRKMEDDYIAYKAHPTNYKVYTPRITDKINLYASLVKDIFEKNPHLK